MIVNSSRGGGSKDTWVLEDGEPDDRAESRLPDPLPAGAARPALRRLDRPGAAAAAGRDRLVLARIAHELYWLGPQPRRAPSSPRASSTASSRSSSRARPPTPRRASSSAGASCWRCSAGPRPARSACCAARRCERLTIDGAAPASMRAAIERAREGARTVRDVISADMWEAINTSALTLRGDGDGELDGARRPVPRRASTSRSACALIAGLADRTMLRDEAKAFLDAGSYMESADMVLRILRVALPARRRRRRRPARRSRCCRRSAASRPTAARSRRRRTRARSRASCSSSAPIPTASPPAWTRCTTRSRRADASPRNSEPVLRLSRMAADLDFQRRTLPDDAEIGQTCTTVASRSSRASTTTSPSATSPAPPPSAARPRSSEHPAMHFAIRHLTSYAYDGPVSDNLNALRVRPATTSAQRCDEFHVRDRPRDPRQPPHRLLRHRGARVRRADRRTST